MFCASCGKSIPDGSAFCPGCGKSITDAPSQSKKTHPLEVLWKIFGAAVIILGAIFFLIWNFSNKNTPPLGSTGGIRSVLPARQPVTQKIFSGVLPVGAGQYQSWTLTISQEMANAQLVGSFHASGGSGNDIQAVVADPAEFENWINGHQARAYYSTEKTTDGQINLRLPPGTYIVAFSNRFSAFTNKEVTADLELRYLR
jgi:predicted nucleic acid-binding Zn ribbon protein